MRFTRILVVTTLTLLVAACGGGGSSASTETPAAVSFVYNVPSDTGDGWATGHLDDHGFDTPLVLEMMNNIENGTYEGIDSVVIVRNNTLLLFAQLRDSLDQFDSWVDNTSMQRHVMHSTSKSVTSALIGIAIDQGYIASMQVPFYELFNYLSYENWDERKSEMTLEDALTMRLGIGWDEWSEPYGTATNDLEVLSSNSNDYAKALLDLPMTGTPGTSFAYNTAATIAIGQALQNSVGVPMEDFAETELFAPMQILTARWGRTPTGLPNGGSGLFLIPRDMAKFGQLFIDDGVWNGQRILSSAWTEASVQRHVSLSWSWTSGYGYQWWLDDFKYKGQEIAAWSTRGYGGQYIFCVPSLELVVTFTGQNYGTAGADSPFALMQDFILPSLAAAN
jgi:CubicO group peptidase (beta-lactamase class C family)